MTRVVLVATSALVVLWIAPPVACRQRGTTEEEFIWKTLHNWQKFSNDLADFDAWVCSRPSVLEVIAEHFVKQNAEDRQLGKWGLKYIALTFTDNRHTLNNFMRKSFSEVLEDTTLTDPNYSIWVMFEEYASHKDESVRGYRKLVANETDDYIVWASLNVNLLIDRLQAYHSARSDLQDMPGFRW